MKKKTDKKTFSITLDEETYEEITKIMTREEISRSEAIRQLIHKSLALEWQNEYSDVVAMLVKKQVDLAMKTHVERLASLISKSGHMSARSAFLNAQVLAELVEQEKRRDIKELWESSSKKAVEYMKKPLKGWDYLAELIEDERKSD